MRWAVGAFGLGVAAYAVALGWAATVWPDRVPVHFGVSGEPDRYADPGTAVLVFAALGAGTAVVLAGAAVLVRRAPMAWVSVRGKDWWTAAPAREAELRRVLAAAVWATGAWVMALLVAVLLLVVAAADEPDPSLGAGPWVVLGVWLVGAALGVWWVQRRTRPRIGE